MFGFYLGNFTEDMHKTGGGGGGGSTADGRGGRWGVSGKASDWLDAQSFKDP